MGESLTKRIKRLFTKQPEMEKTEKKTVADTAFNPDEIIDPFEPESIRAILVPRALVAGGEFDTDNLYALHNLQALYDETASENCKHLFNAYRMFFNVSRNQDADQITYIFEKDEIKVTYHVANLDHVHCNSAIIIEQPRINIDKAVSFLQLLAKRHLLSYRKDAPINLGLFLYARSYKLCGTDALKVMDLRVHEVAEYVSDSVGYKHRQFDGIHSS